MEDDLERQITEQINRAVQLILLAQKSVKWTYRYPGGERDQIEFCRTVQRSIDDLITGLSDLLAQQGAMIRRNAVHVELMKHFGKHGVQ